jgi:TldD protein
VSRLIDEAFLALPLTAATDAALSTAKDLGATHADVRIASRRHQSVSVRDARLEDQSDDTNLGMSVRVLVDGAWGFAAGDAVTTDTAVELAKKSVALARVAGPLALQKVELAPEQSHRDTWISAFDIDPFDIPAAEKADLLIDWNTRLLAGGVDHATASVAAIRELSHYADLGGSAITQLRIRIDPELAAVRVLDSGVFDSMKTLAPPVGRGWEYVTSGWDFDSEIREIPELLAEKLQAPSVTPGHYDLIIDPTNLWLTIHESVGHATELDRALGYEANYAGTSFATPDKLGTLRYGSEHMNIVGDRVTRHGLATIGFDDEGVAAQQWDIVRDGVLVGYQLDRSMAHRFGQASNGCAYADSAEHFPIQRMPNVSLQAAEGGPTTAEMISGIEDGIYVVGDRSWSIDMQRYNFQFTGQRFHRIRNGELVGQLRDVAYQSNTLDFWGRLARVGGPSTYRLGGAVNCGKGQPAQVAPVSHGCPTTQFTGINILNSVAEAGA